MKKIYYLAAWLLLAAIPLAAQNYQQVQKLTASDGDFADSYGNSVDISGNYIIVGANEDLDEGGAARGKAFIYKRTSTGWREDAKLFVENLDSWNFGTSVSISGSYAVVGGANRSNFEGVAYIYQRTASGWQKVTKIRAADGNSSNWFGTAVAISDNYVLAGSAVDDNYWGNDAGAIYFFENKASGSGNDWQQKYKLTPPLTPNAQFGYSVAMSGDFAIIGAPGGKNQQGVQTGSVYIYKKSSGVYTWEASVKLTPSDGMAGDEFGSSVAIYGNTAIIGTHIEGKPGVAYIFEKNGDAWQQTAKLVSPEGIIDKYSRISVSISNNQAVIGDQGTDKKGLVFIYSKTATGWKYTNKIAHYTGECVRCDMYNIVSVAISGKDLVIGDPTVPDVAILGGAAYVYSNTDPLVQASIARFSLINAKTDQVIPAYADLQEGAVINLGNTGLSGSDKYNQLNLEAVTSPATVGSVKFILKGPFSTAPVENGAPYAIFSDSNGNYDGGSLPVGSYTLTAIPYSEAKKGGVEGESKTIHFTVVDGAVEEPTPPEEPDNDVLSIARFSLINAKTDEVIPAYANLQEGAVINLANTGLSGSDKYSQLNIEAVTNPSTVGSVKFILKGPASLAPVDNGVPYAIFGDYRGDYKAGSLPVGSYTLTAIPFSEAKRSGTEGTRKTIHFTVVDGAVEEPTPPEEPGNDNNTLAIARFSLINAKTDEVISTYADLQEGAVINLSNTGLSGGDKYSQLNIDAITHPTTVGSVRLVLSGATSASTTQSQAPYPIFSDSNGNYNGGSLPVGSYTLTAIPYSEPKRNGVEGTSKTIHFTVVDGAVEEPEQPVSGDMEFRERQKLTASDGKAKAYFGSVISISGDVAVIGASNDADDGFFAGAAYIFEKNRNGLWEEKQKIVAHDTKTMSNFGSAVSVSGNTLIVRARDDDYGENTGAAYIFENDGTSWKEVDKVYASDAARTLDFASTVSLSGTQAVFGSLKSKAYIFEKTSAGWKEVAKLQPPDANSNVGFGRIVSISGNTIAVGANGAYESSEKSGAVFIYNKTTSGWSLVKTLTAPQGTYAFGKTLQINGNQMIIGAGNGAFIYEKSTAGWQQTVKVLTDDGSNANLYGYNAVSISGKYAVVGDEADPEKNYGPGEAYLFEKTTKGWMLKSKILASDGKYYEHFGSKVSVEHDHILISSIYNNEKGGGSGAVYSFELSEMPTDLSIDRFALINANTDQTIPGFEDIKDGAIIDLAKLGISGDILNIDAVTYPEKVGSVRLELSGTKSASTTQSQAPYPIFSDSNGNYLAGSLPVGSYTLTAIPFSEPKRNGIEGESKTIHFSVVNKEPALSIKGFDLINADNNEKLINIRDGEEINLYYFSSSEFDIVTNNFNIEAITTSAKAGSVEMEVYYNGSLLIKTLDSMSPYSFFGGIGGDFSKWQPKLGNYRIKATPYSGANKSGEVGQVLEISFKIFNESIGVPRFSSTDKKKGNNSQEKIVEDKTVTPVPFTLYPNPATTILHIDYAGEREEELLLSVYNASGQLIRQKTGIGVLEEEMDFREQPPGMYMAVLLHNGKRLTQKFIIWK